MLEQSFMSLFLSISPERLQRWQEQIEWEQYTKKKKRERAFDEVKSRSLSLQNTAGDKLRVERARTEAQRERNWAMR